MNLNNVKIKLLAKLFNLKKEDKGYELRKIFALMGVDFK